MNISESVLYPSFYFRDMAFFMAKFVTQRFEGHHADPVPPSLSPCCSTCSSCGSSDSLLITTAINDQFSSQWESHLYDDILRTLELSEFDESVVIGTVVLLDMMRDMANTSQRRRVDGNLDHPVLVLPSIPHENYFNYFVGAFMLAYHLLSDNQSIISPDRWSEIMGGMVPGQQVMQIEEDFRKTLETHMNSYEEPEYFDDDAEYKTVYVQDEVTAVPPNPFISEDRYLHTKLTMYTHIRLRMTMRGQEPTFPLSYVANSTVLDFSLAFPPCESEMKYRRTMLDNARMQVEAMRHASDREVFSWVMGGRDRTDEEFDELVFSSLMLGKGILGLRELEDKYVVKVKKSSKKGTLNDWIVV